MFWFHLSLFSAAAKASNQAITKTLTRDFSVLEIAAFGQLTAGILILPLIFLPGLVTVPGTLSFHKAAAVTIFLNIIAIILLIEAIRRSDLSYSMPFLGLTPVFSIFMGWMLRGEVVSLPGVLGIFLIFFGALGIDAHSCRDWASLGGKRIFRDQGVRLIIIVAFIYSVSSVYDKSATLLSDPLTFVWYSAMVRAAILLLFYYGTKHASPASKAQKAFSLPQGALFALLGITFLAEALFQMVALQTGLVAYVIAIKRLSILMTSLVGMIVYKEVFSMARLAGATLIMVGAGVIYLLNP